MPFGRHHDHRDVDRGGVSRKPLPETSRITYRYAAQDISQPLAVTSPGNSDCGKGILDVPLVITGHCTEEAGDLKGHKGTSKRTFIATCYPALLL